MAWSTELVRTFDSGEERMECLTNCVFACVTVVYVRVCLCVRACEYVCACDFLYGSVRVCVSMYIYD